LQGFTAVLGAQFPQNCRKTPAQKAINDNCFNAASMRLVERPAPGNKIAAKLHVKFGIVFVTSGGSVRKAQRKLFLHPPPAEASTTQRLRLSV